ncbi:MAG: radical SAM protein [Candidatus Bathyarchaeia archaeon]|nr:radical SAM protein [Candidatus Bathyarchaeia archaeon]
MPLISRFDPWRSSLCTCPSKLTLNPYSGCDHHCVYCYASNYVPRFQECRPKKGLLRKLQREASKLKGETVSISNSSDPYPRKEATAGLTRRCLEILAESNCRIQVITKSNLVTRDDDLLSKAPSTVALSITTLDAEVARLLEPNAPPPAERLIAAENLIGKGLPVSVRIDPVIPFVNDKAEKLVTTLAGIGVKHVTSSTYKIKPDNWRRFKVAMPDVAKKLEHLYFRDGQRLGGNTLLPRNLRLNLMKNIRNLATANGMKFGVCREGLTQLNTAACDGSWLLNAETR